MLLIFILLVEAVCFTSSPADLECGHDLKVDWPRLPYGASQDATGLMDLFSITSETFFHVKIIQ